MARVIGADISFYQDKPSTPERVNFNKLKSAGEFIIIRAGQSSWADPNFAYNYEEAKKAGLPRGSYWFYDSRTDPKKQAELWISTLAGDLGELPLFADFEETYGGDFKGWKNWHIFLERVRALVGPEKEIGIYTGFYYWRENIPLDPKHVPNLAYFKQFPLWIAHYGPDKPRVPAPWGENDWLFWQYTETGDGKSFGVESKEIDLNYFNGDLSDFNKRFGLNSSTTETSTLPTPADAGLLINKTISLDLSTHQGPGSAFAINGTLNHNDSLIIEGYSQDKKWAQVRRTNDGLTGWLNLNFFSAEPIPAQPVATPPPAESASAEEWYRVIAATLQIREGADSSFAASGHLIKDDIVQAIEYSADKAWTQIKRIDGLIGWTFSSYLEKVSEETPLNINQKIFEGATYFRKVLNSPRKMVANVIGIDLHTPNLSFFVTPSRNKNGVLCAQTTSEFLTDFKVQIAINGDAFTQGQPNLPDSNQSCPDGNVPLKSNGYAASKGIIYNNKQTGQPILYINKENKISFNRPTTDVYHAISGDKMVVFNGKPVPTLVNDRANPRTALGISANGRWLILMVIDGRQPRYSEGATYTELADLLISLGVNTGITLDGGGSSTMVIEDVNKKAQVLNSPIDSMIPGKERPVANHLGIFLKNK